MVSTKHLCGKEELKSDYFTGRWYDTRVRIFRGQAREAQVSRVRFYFYFFLRVAYKSGKCCANATLLGISCRLWSL